MASLRILDERDTRAARATTSDTPNKGWLDCLLEKVLVQELSVGESSE